MSGHQQEVQTCTITKKTIISKYFQIAAIVALSHLVHVITRRQGECAQSCAANYHKPHISARADNSVYSM